MVVLCKNASGFHRKLPAMAANIRNSVDMAEFCANKAQRISELIFNKPKNEELLG